MEKDAQRLLDEALLLPEEERQALIAALEESLEPSEAAISQLVSNLNETASRLIDEAQETARRRSKSDFDVPNIWHSSYYLRQGYHLNPTGRGKFEHWQGGEARHRSAVCAACGTGLHLLWDIDCTDSRFRKESADAFGKLDRLPLYYCLRCPNPTIYRCAGNRRIHVMPTEDRQYEESPFSGYPDVFPRRRIAFKPIPSEIENLLLICQQMDPSWLCPADRRKLASYLGVGLRWIPFELRRSQLGGIPACQQGDSEIFCPYDKCPTHSYGNPLFRNKRLYRMKLLATIAKDAGLEMETSCAQIVFHICWGCQTIHSEYQID